MEEPLRFRQVEHHAEAWVLFTEVLNAALLADPKAANQKCEQLPQIERSALPGLDQRERYMRMRDIPVLLARYSRISPEQSAAFALILQALPSEITGVEPPTQNAGRRKASRESKPDKLSPKPGANAGSSTWKMRGDRWGEFYASSFTAYFALTCLVVALAVLHASAGWRMLPQLPRWEILALSVLMQSIVLVGTVNANFFTEDRQYRYFLAGFAAYDMLMSACNFFYGYDPDVLASQQSNAAQIIAGITDLGIRTGFTVAFPLATVFFAALVKKMRSSTALRTQLKN